MDVAEPARGLHAAPASEISRIQARRTVPLRRRPVAPCRAQESHDRDSRRPCHVHQAGIFADNNGSVQENRKCLPGGGLAGDVRRGREHESDVPQGMQADKEDAPCCVGAKSTFNGPAPQDGSADSGYHGN